DPVPPPDPIPEPPEYRDEVSLYTALPAMGLRYGWATLGNLHERVGEQEQLRARSDLRGRNSFNGAWIRVIGEDGDVRGSRRGIYGEGPKYDYSIVALQVGMDVYAKEDADEDNVRDHAGFYVGDGRIRTSVHHYDGSYAGRNEVEGPSVGLYWTRYGDQGDYLDLVWQGTWAKGTARSSNGQTLERRGFGWAMSAETGYPWHYSDDDPDRILEPQLQLIYQHADKDQDADAYADVRFREMESLAGRLGLRWADSRKLEPTNEGIPRLFTGWLRLNLWHEFRGRPVTEFSSAAGYIPFAADISGSWWQLNAGMTWQWGAATSLYANVGYQHGFSRSFEAWDGKVGVRWNW
ncbi:MAG TPA: autotransporter outer membrane beta-barrel domain-containing protein, partial [Burkholderiaceae bacterium]|nr:autotransporter outer membrane beta-barrel domain-containing protein [Burkholderiaceae bacterium]